MWNGRRHLLITEPSCASMEWTSLTPYKPAEMASNTPSPVDRSPRREEDDDDGFEGRQQAHVCNRRCRRGGGGGAAEEAKMIGDDNSDSSSSSSTNDDYSSEPEVELTAEEEMNLPTGSEMSF
jgi:hypothetical protein